jgi:DNA repair protein RadC
MKRDDFTSPEITVSYKDRVKTSERAIVTCSKDGARIFMEACKDCMEHHEEVYVLLLNRANRVLGISNVAKGGMSNSLIDVRIILQTALRASASAIMLSHNHPSGSTKPSAQDLAITREVQKGCEAIGIQLLDHVIVTGEAYTSFADSRLL